MIPVPVSTGNIYSCPSSHMEKIPNCGTPYRGNFRRTSRVQIDTPMPECYKFLVLFLIFIDKKNTLINFCL